MSGFFRGFYVWYRKMPSFAYKEDLLSSFLDLSPRERERIFSISCIEPSHWEASPSWDISTQELDGMILDATRELLEDWQYENLDRKGQLEDVKSSFYHADMINRLMCSYLSHELNHRCVPESDGSTEQFDVTIYRDDMPLCDIGIKRMATSSQISEYLNQHRDKVQSIGRGNYSVLFLYYPITDISDSKRVREFVFGYEYLSPKIDPFYESPNNYISVIPAPLEPTDEDIFPLYETKDFIQHKLGLSR